MQTNTTTASPTIVAYYRVSTARQGSSGLGLEAQQAAVKAAYPAATIVEFTEVESGKNNTRPILAAALAHAKSIGAFLVVAKLDRLARNVSFLFALKEAGVQFAALDMPDLNTLTLGMLATIAQHERETTSARTKAALQAKKARGIKLGSPANLTDDARAKGRASHSAKAAANPNTIKAQAMAKALHATGTSIRKIADQLNQYGFITARGGAYMPTQVVRLLN
jgi:DNA invertase Pin-like site-specific DNA recombinase